MIKFMQALILFLSLAVAHAEAPQPYGNAAVIAQANAYLAAYAKLDINALERLYTEDAVFNDPTSTNVPGIGGPFVWKGRAEILAHLREWAKTTKSLNYDVERRYEASNHVVFVGAVKPLVKTAKGDVQYRYPIVTIITIANGRVSEHRDYTNYAAGRVVPPSSP
ncbi:MAG: nuclear transport factor 2 family protein [Alphaproteobacteria bacterium]|nr:nuclear transport factor 2 family protein [Alphaproteobacteria bacterium]